MKVGEMVKYMSRTILIIDMDDDWVHGIELGETQVGKYRRSYLEKNKWRYESQKES